MVSMNVKLAVLYYRIESITLTIESLQFARIIANAKPRKDILKPLRLRSAKIPEKQSVS